MSAKDTMTYFRHHVSIASGQQSVKTEMYDRTETGVSLSLTRVSLLTLYEEVMVMVSTSMFKQLDINGVMDAVVIY